MHRCAALLRNFLLPAILAMAVARSATAADSRAQSLGGNILLIHDGATVSLLCDLGFSAGASELTLTIPAASDAVTVTPLQKPVQIAQHVSNLHLHDRLWFQLCLAISGCSGFAALLMLLIAGSGQNALGPAVVATSIGLIAMFTRPCTLGAHDRYEFNRTTARLSAAVPEILLVERSPATTAMTVRAEENTAHALRFLISYPSPTLSVRPADLDGLDRQRTVLLVSRPKWELSRPALADGEPFGSIPVSGMLAYLTMEQRLPEIPGGACSWRDYAQATQCVAFVTYMPPQFPAGTTERIFFVQDKENDFNYRTAAEGYARDPHAFSRAARLASLWLWPIFCFAVAFLTMRRYRCWSIAKTFAAMLCLAPGIALALRSKSEIDTEAANPAAGSRRAAGVLACLGCVYWLLSLLSFYLDPFFG